MLIAIFAALAAAFSAAWGAFWALVRDQDGPYFQGKPDDAPSNKWKESGVGLFGLPLGLLWLATCNDPLQVAAIGAAVIWVGMSGAWTKGHNKGLGMEDLAARWAMAWTGGIVTLAPALVLGWYGHVFLAPLVLLAGVAKVGTYWLGYRMRRGKYGWPHANAIGAVLHGAIAVGATAAAMVLA